MANGQRVPEPGATVGEAGAWVSTLVLEYS